MKRSFFFFGIAMRFLVVQCCCFLNLPSRLLGQFLRVSLADCVLVLKGGEVVEQGPYATLLRLNGELSSLMAGGTTGPGYGM